ncbi:transmembrane protein 94-like isoform X9 [Convolutriloba macropyga]|uniref:transmembrane protein 94-like isoform X9 n=1 Tax=Convolutriloba macropyga TaxID=536237 RepID=UPI003F520A59
MFVYDNKGPSPTVYDSGITHGKVNNLNNVVNKDNTSITLAPQLSTSSHYHPSLPAPLTTDHDTYSGCPPEQVTDSPVPTSLKNTPSDYSQLLLKPTSDVTSEPSKYFTSNSFPRRNFMPNSSNDDGHESRSRDVGTRHTSGAFTPKGVSTEPYAPSSRHNQNRNYPHLSRRHRSHATSRDDILGDSHTALSSGPAGAPNYVTLTNDSDPRSLLFDKAHLARDSRSIYEGHYYPNPNYLQNQSQSNRNFTSSLSRNQHYQSNERDAISHQHQHHQNRHNLGSQRDLDSCDIPESRSSRSRHFRDSSPLKRKPFHESSSSNHRYPGDFQSQTSLAGRGNLSNRKELSKRDLQMRSQPDLSFSMTNNEFNNSNSHTASMNRSAINIHQGVLHHIDAADNTNNNSSMMNNGPPGVVNLNNSTLSGTGGIPGISMVPNNAKLGLSSKQALERLFHEVNNELQEFSRQQSIKRSLRSFWMSLPFHYHHKLTTLRFHEFLLILTAAVSLLCCYLFEKSLGGTLIIESMGILILLFLSSLISWWDVKLQVNDMYTRAQNLLDQIQETLLYMQQHTSHPAASAVQPLSSLSGVNSSNSINSNLNTSQLGSVWPQSLYPSLHAPISPSVSLQWTHRDHHLVNLPANLLVRGDVVEIRPGQAVFARVKQLQTSKGDPLGLVLNPGETYNPLEGQADDPCPTARLHSPMDRLACVVQETPFITQLRKCLNHGGSSRERSAWDNRRYAVVDFIEMKVVPIAVLTGLFINGVLFIKLGHYVGHQIEMYLLHQIYILIPLVPLLFPVLWLMWTGLTTASLLASCQQQGSVSRGEAVSGSWYHFKFSWRHFISIISGMSPSLSRTSNLLYGLGSTTIFSVVDKRGVLSWPNPKVERVFFIRPVEQPDDTVSPAESTSGRPPNSDDRGGGGGDGGNDSDTGSMNAVYVPEVMDLSCDHNESFFVHFDDERWQQHLPSLKPLGLNILLNTCNEYVEDSYTKFADHLLCVSSLENHSIAVVNRSWTRALQSRCACELSEAIGFAKNATESYEVKNYIQSFRESQPFDPSDTFKMRRIKAILRKKTPFPFLCSVVVHDTSTGLQQLFTQGTADMLCDVCPDFWDGKGIHPLSPELRKKIHDFYTRASLSAYCTAFAYRPVFSDFSKVLDNFYLELPGGKKFQPNPTSVLADMENVHSTDFVSDAKGLAKAQSGQIFLGMVVMQYKAMPDVLDLIEDFESRCIRFVHFSHENELRSRIFAEKLGLETGWNCHVSLFANSSGNEHQSSEHSSKAASLTTLRSFAQNVIQANEKLKTLQSQNNIDINSAPSNVDENRITRDGVKDMNESVSTPASPALNSMSNRISHSLGPTMERGVSHRGREFHDGASSMSRHQSHRSLARSQNLDQGPNATTGPSSMQQTSHPVNQETSFNNQMTSTAEVSDRKQFASHHQHHHLQHQNAIGQHQQQYSGMNTGSTAISRENSVHSHLKPSRKYVEIGVQTAGEKQEDSISLKGHEEAGLDEMFLRLEKLEQLKRQSQEEVNLVSGMNAIHTNKSANHNLRPGGVWENNMSSIGVDTRDAIAEQDEFISLPPMSPGSISESSSGAVSPLPNPRDHNSSHVNHSHNFPGSLTSNVRNPQGAPCLSHTNSVSPQPPMMAPSQSMHTQKHLTSRGTVNDTPSCDLSGSGNSPVEFCYQCSTLNNSNVLSANQNRVVPGGGIESQCSSIESTCMNYPHQNAMPGSGVNHLQKVSERPCPQPCCYSAPNTCNSHAQQNIAPDNNYCTQCNHNANNQGLNISHHGSNNTLLSNRAKSPLDTTLEQQRGVVQNSSSIRSNPSRRSGPPVPIRRYATLSGTENQYADHTTDASEALLNTTYSNQTQYSNHNQQFSNNVHNSGYPGNQVNSSGTGFKTRAPGLSRTGSINSQITHVQDDAISRTSEQSFGLNSLAGTEGVMFDDLYDLSNRAKLPRGVENIRPHLEHVDNVPLLVPLFTDCTPEATKEMMTIMQENSEVVCVYGSSLNVTNIDIFLQADVSIGVMPYVPQPCVRQPVCFEPFLPDGRHLSPLGLASALGSLPCSLQTLRNVSLTNIFHSASRLSENLKTALLFLLSCHLALILTQVLSAVCFQPPPFSGSLILWLVGFILPLLATSLLANPICDNSLQWTTASKNFKKILKTDVRDFITVFAMRFLPTCILLPLLEMTILYTMCIFVTAEEHCLLSHGNTNSTEVWNGYRGSYRGALVVAQNLVTWLLVVHFCFISASFVFPRTYIWRKAPFRNVVWAIMCPLIIGLQLFYFYSDVQTYRSTPFSIPNTPGHVWVMGAAWSFVALFISEMVKVYQVRKAYRQHRRSKLQFGTKLGMNSPF